MSEPNDELMNMLAMFSEVSAIPEPGIPQPEQSANPSGHRDVQTIVASEIQSSPAHELPTLMRVLRTLPPEQRLECLELAQALEISEQSDQLLYSILVGLGLHKTLLLAVPDQIAEAGEQVKSEFLAVSKSRQAELAEILAAGSENIILAGHQSISDIQQVIQSATAQIQVAAGKGAQNAVSNMNITPLVEAAISEIAGQTELTLAKKWFSRSLIIASISAVLIAVGSGYSGFKLAGMFNPASTTNGSNEYLNQLQCGAPNNGVIPCRDQFGNTLKLKSR